MTRGDNEEERLQLGLVHLQEAAIAAGDRIVLILEGRDAAGKDGLIKALTKHLSTRSTRIVALPKPTERERGQWYFQRYVAHLPSAGELVVFNRSWYNRAGVEVVNGFSSEEEQALFLRHVPVFEEMLVDSGIQLVKLWLDIDKKEQAKRLEERATDPLKALKRSPLDAVAQDKWAAYTAARDTMLTRTHTAAAPWICVRADDKPKARRAAIRYLLKTLAPKDVANAVKPPNPDIVFGFEQPALTDGRLAR